MTRQLQALHALGHVHVTADPRDGRASLVEATERGRAELRSFDEIGLDVFAAVVQEWSDEDLRLLTTLLERMLDTWARRGDEQRGEVHARSSKMQRGEPWWAGS